MTRSRGSLPYLLDFRYRPEADITRISTYRALMTDNRHSRDNVAPWVELVARLQSTRLWN